MEQGQCSLQYEDTKEYSVNVLNIVANNVSHFERTFVATPDLRLWIIPLSAVSFSQFGLTSGHAACWEGNKHND